MNRIASYLFIITALYSACPQAEDDVKQLIIKQTIAFHPDKFPFQELVKWIGDREVVLLGDATHGSREFYRYRAQISRYLITHHGFSTIIVEGSWPAGQKVNHYIHYLTDNSANLALSAFKGYFPWLWRNQTMLEFVKWLRLYNKGDPQQIISFYGMDLFSLADSISRNTELLKKYNTPFSSPLIDLFHCFAKFNNNGMNYGQQLAKNLEQSCQAQAEQQYSIISKHPQLLKNKTDYFDLLLNSLMIRAVEQYFRMNINAQAKESWNMRERFMQDIINIIVHQQKKHHGTSKVIIWAHNSHVGDARATAMREQQRESLGQLLRQQLGKQKVFLLGALSYQGELMASKEWGGAAKVMGMSAAMEGSYSYLFHQLSLPQFIMNFNALTFSPFYQRFIGVVYESEEEQLYHYSSAVIDQQFDAILFVDQTTAVQALD